MSDNLMKVTIITPDHTAFDGDARFLVARAMDGDVGILPGHAPLLAALKIWPLRLQMPDAERGTYRSFAVFGGFMDVGADGVTIVTPNCEEPQSIDRARAERAKERAEKRLASQDPAIDTERAEAALARALMRISITSR